jgi:hypothetical protein
MWGSVQTLSEPSNTLAIPNVSEIIFQVNSLRNMNMNIKVSKSLVSALAAAIIAGAAGGTYAQQIGNTPKAGDKPGTIGAPNLESSPSSARPYTNGVMMRDGKMMVRKDGKTMEMDSDMTMPNGEKVMRDGRVMTKDGKSRMMKNGDAMDMKGMKMTVEKDTDG